MKICIDARSLRQVATGVGRYAANLVRALADLDGDNSYVILQRASAPEPIVTRPNVAQVLLPHGIVSARNLLAGARDIDPLGADVYHALFHLLPRGLRTGRRIVTLHDLHWVLHRSLSYPGWVRRWVKCGLTSPLIRRALESADHIIADSDATRVEAIQHFALRTSKLTTIYLGVEPAFFHPAPAADLPAVCRGRRFVFHLGNSLPYKNLPRLVAAFARIAPADPQLLLLIAGRDDGHPALARQVERLGLSGRVVLSPPLDGAQVHACYAHAACFAFPSLSEGFGLPVLEAMASGCPVLTSSISAPAEVASDAALRVDPYDVAAIAAGLRLLLEDGALRRQLVDRGRRRAAAFTWQTCAERTLAIYRQLA